MIIGIFSAQLNSGVSVLFKMQVFFTGRTSCLKIVVELSSYSGVPCEINLVI